MPLPASSLRRVWAPLLIAFGVFLLLAGLLAAPTAAAREPAAQEPPQPPPPPAPPVVFQSPIPIDQLAFLSGYAGQRTKDLEKDKRFHTLVKEAVPRTEYHYGRDMPLSEAIDNALVGSKLPVEIREGRYVTVSGSQGSYLRGRGFLWFDLQLGT